MKNLILISLLQFIILKISAQSSEVFYSNKNDTNSNYYIAFKPAGQINGLLILLPSFGETPKIASNETSLQKAAADKGLITVFASLQYGYFTFYIDSLSQNNLDKLIDELQKKYNVKDKPLYLGGFSLGGAGVVKYAERAYSSSKLVRPKAIFAIDPPLDFEKLFISLQNAVRHSTVEIARKEAAYFIERLQFEFKSTPHSNINSYKIISPFLYSDTNQTNIKLLSTCPVRLISEPEIIWQMTERDRSVFDLNLVDCSQAITALRLLGNRNAELIVTTDKGYRKLTGKKNPHSWSIADADQTINWLVSQK